MKKYFFAESGKFWDVFPACIVTTGKTYEAFPKKTSSHKMKNLLSHYIEHN